MLELRNPVAAWIARTRTPYKIATLSRGLRSAAWYSAQPRASEFARIFGRF